MPRPQPPLNPKHKGVRPRYLDNQRTLEMAIASVAGQLEAGRSSPAMLNALANLIRVQEELFPRTVEGLVTLAVRAEISADDLLAHLREEWEARIAASRPPNPDAPIEVSELDMEYFALAFPPEENNGT